MGVRLPVGGSGPVLIKGQGACQRPRRCNRDSPHPRRSIPAVNQADPAPADNATAHTVPRDPTTIRRIPDDRSTRASDSHKPPPVTVRNAPKPVPLQGSADPRWVLAVRTAECLQGDILAPESRERIIRMARLFDLTPFDANMIIAIVQDQARRGIAPHLCAAAGEPQLRMITPPRRKTILQAIKSRYGMKVVLLLGTLLAIEVILVLWAF